MNPEFISKKSVNQTDENDVQKEHREENSTDGRPSPTNFDVFLPWACCNMGVEVNVIVTRVKQSEYVSSTQTDRSKSKAKLPVQKHESDESDGSDDTNFTRTRTQKHSFVCKQNVQIYAYYDSFENLVHIKFDKNKFIPRRVIQIISLISQFHPSLTSVTINRGLDMYILHEIDKLAQLSAIADLCLDGTYVKEANYYILFENKNCLRQVSLARCAINDDVLQKIANNLAYPLPTSKSLSALNLSSNRITDTGVAYLAEVLRSNRRLLYLNLADNMISDDGASALLDITLSFPMTSDESLRSKQRYMQYIKRKKDMIAMYVSELRTIEDRKSAKRKNTKPAPVLAKKAVKGLEKEPSLKSISLEVNKSSTNIDSAYLEKAEVMALNSLGSFQDPFSPICTETKDGRLHCLGNNTLAYLNFAYNNLSFVSLKKILKVVTYQRLLNRKPKGLINLRLEGNRIPICKELLQIDDILERALMMPRSSIAGLKRPRVLNLGKGK